MDDNNNTMDIMKVADFLRELKTNPENVTNLPDRGQDYFNNNITDTLSMMFLSLTKISYLPFMKSNELPNKQLIELNTELIDVQNMLLTYWQQEFVILQMTKKIIDDEINSVIKNVDCDLNDLKNVDLKNVECITNKLIEETKQTGGTLSPNLIKVILFLYFLVIISSNTFINDTESNITSNNITSNNIISNNIISKVESNPQDSTSDIVIFNPKTTQINVNNIINQDKNFYVQLTNILNIVAGGKSLDLPEIIAEFNNKMLEISKDVETNCLELVNTAKNKNVFKNWKELKDIQATVDNLESIEGMLNANDRYNKKEFVENTKSFVASVVAAPVTQDVVSPLKYFMSAVGNMQDLLLNTKPNDVSVISDSVADNSLADNSLANNFLKEKNLIYGSQVYCLSGFKMSLTIVGSDINLEGSSISYQQILTFINELNVNLNEQMNQPNIDESTRAIFESLKQRLNILEAITEYLNLFISHSGINDIRHMNKIANSKNRNNLNNYLNKFTAEFETLSEKFKLMYPKNKDNIDQLKTYLKEETEHLNDEKMIYNENQQLLNEKDAQTQKQSQDKTRRFVKKINSVLNNSKELVLSGITGVLGFGMGIGTGTLNYVVEQSIEEGVYLQYAILGFLMKSPLFWTTLVTIGLAISIKIAGLEGTLRGLSNGGKSIIMITSGPFIFIYELIQTPFGYKWNPVNNLGLPRISKNSKSSDGFDAVDHPEWAIWNPGTQEIRQRAQQVLENVQNLPPQQRVRNSRWGLELTEDQMRENERLLRQQRRLGKPSRWDKGGKLIYKNKTRANKTRKNKKRKTKKLKVKNKRRHTRNKNGGRTKRR
jgi:hypothetical protein